MSARSSPGPRTAVCALAALAAVAALAASTARPSVAGEDKERARRLEDLVRRARDAVVVLKLPGTNGPAVASGVLVRRPTGGACFIATSKSRLLGAGEGAGAGDGAGDGAGKTGLEAFVFRMVRHDGGRVTVEREPLGRAEVVALHRSADAAVLRLAAAPDLPALPRGAIPRAGVEVVVCGAPGAVHFEAATDLAARDGVVLDVPPDGGPHGPKDAGTQLTAPVHLNNSGGAVLGFDGTLVGIAAELPRQGVREDEDAGGEQGSAARGLAVPLARFDELLAGSEDEPGRSDHALGPEETARHLAPRAGLPYYLRASPGGPEGKRVPLGQGVFVVKAARAVIASGVFILDEHDVLEYFACPLKNGKLHETVIALDAKPYTVSLALMMLGYRSGGGVEVLGDPSVPRGDGVAMYVEWDPNEARAIGEYLPTVEPAWKRPNHVGVREKIREGVVKWKPGPKVRVRAEDLIFERYAGHPMERTSWVYTGSTFGKDPETNRRFFRADSEGVLAAVYRDPSAVFNIPHRGGEDDTYYCVDGTKVPPRGTRCTLIIVPPGPPPGPPPE